MPLVAGQGRKSNVFGRDCFPACLDYLNNVLKIILFRFGWSIIQIMFKATPQVFRGWTKSLLA